MPQSLVKILVHAVFSTKGRADLISPELEPRLYAYMSGIVANNGARLVAANGTTNHSHFLLSLGRAGLMALIGDMKRDSSLWVKKQSPAYAGFYWQKGYGAFSVGQSQVAAVTRYIADQKIHHLGHSYQDEFRELCQKYEVDLDEKYCWD